MNQPYQSPDNGADPQPETYQPALFQGSGRLGRVRYFVYLATVSVVVYGFFSLLMLIGNIGGSRDYHELLVMAAFLLGGLASVIVLVMSVLFGVRRLNDINASGWLILLMLIPLANFVLGLVLLFVPGSRGVNKYGPPAEPNSSGVMAAMLILILMIIGWIGIFGGVAIATYQRLDNVQATSMHDQGARL